MVGQWRPNIIFRETGDDPAAELGREFVVF
jgi:hypothetical protein